MTQAKKHVVRKWLRPVSSETGKFTYIVVDFTKDNWGDYHITLSDCSRTISYDLYCDDINEDTKPKEAARLRRIKKENLAMLRQLAKEITKAADWYEENVKAD